MYGQVGSAGPEKVAFFGLDDDRVYRALAGSLHDLLDGAGLGVNDFRDAASIETKDTRRARFAVPDADAAALVYFHQKIMSLARLAHSPPKAPAHSIVRPNDFWHTGLS